MRGDLTPEARALFDRLRHAESPPPEGLDAFRARLAARRLHARERHVPWSLVVPAALAACVALALLLTRRPASDETPSLRELSPAPELTHAPPRPRVPAAPPAVVVTPATLDANAAPDAAIREDRDPLRVDPAPPQRLPRDVPRAPTPREVAPAAITPKDAGVASPDSMTGTLLLSTIPASRCVISRTGANHSTPWRVVLPAGRHAVTCRNDALSLTASFSVQIGVGETVRMLNRRLE